MLPQHNLGLGETETDREAASTELCGHKSHNSSEIPQTELVPGR